MRVPRRRDAGELHRVLLVIGQLGRGGTERQLVLLAGALKASGVDVRVASLYGGGPREDELRELRIPTWIGDVPSKRHVWRLFKALFAFWRMVRTTRPDVVHAFLFHAYVIAAPVARWAGVPVVVAGRRSLGTFLEGRWFLQRAERITARCCDALVANATAVAEDTRRREHVGASRVHVIPNALPPASFRAPSDPTRARKRPPELLCVANLIGYKGHRDLLCAVALLERPVRVVLAGEGTERQSLQALAAELELDVVFLGARDDVTALLATADIFVLPSHEEGMSNALMEAMAAGLPCVATDVGGNREVLGSNGVLCRARDSADLARALGDVLSDESWSRDLAAAARVSALERFGVSALGEAHVSLYRELLKGLACAA